MPSELSEGHFILTKKKKHKVQTYVVQDDLKQQTSEALTTDTRKQFSKNRVRFRMDLTAISGPMLCLIFVRE